MVTSNSAASASIAARASRRSLSLSSPASAANSSSAWSRHRQGQRIRWLRHAARAAPPPRATPAVARRTAWAIAKRWRRSARLARSAKRRCTSSSAESNPFAAFDRAAATGTDRPQRQPLTVVASKTRPQPGAQERRLAGARGAENHEQARRLARRKPAQRVDAAHDISATSEEDGSILGLERFEPAIGRPPAEWAIRDPAAARMSRVQCRPSSSPRLRLFRPASAIWTGDWRCVRGWIVRKRSAGSPLRCTTCHCAVSPPGRRSSGMSSISSANSFLLSLLASWYSSTHHFEASQSSDTRNSTASQRVAASSSARAQRWPAAMPRSGSRSRKMSSSPLQPSRMSQSRSASAQSSFLLEWLMNSRDKARAPQPVTVARA